MNIDIGQVYGILVHIDFDDRRMSGRFGKHAPGCLPKWRSPEEMRRNKVVREELSAALGEAIDECKKEYAATGRTFYEFAYSLEHEKTVGIPANARSTTMDYTVEFDIRFDDGLCKVTVTDIYPDAFIEPSAAGNGSSVAA